MGSAYYLGERRRYRGRKRLPYTLSILFLILLAIALYIRASLFPALYRLCETSLSNRLEMLASQAAYTALKNKNCSYTDFVRLSYAADGSVTSASVDTVRLNLLKTELALGVLSALRTGNITVSVPVGNLTHLLLLSGKGKELPITVRVAEGMRVRFHTEFTTEGMNQTRHRIGFSLHFSAVYLLAAKEKTFSFAVEIPIGETLIVGKVPDSLTQINRLSEEITELEIDDAVDFGNVLS